MSGAQQISFMNQRSFKPPTPTVIGQAYEGGFWAGDISTTANSVATHHIVIGPKATAETALAWKTSTTSTAGTTSNIDGPANTAAMIAAGAAAHPCANFCNNLVLGGFSDWYMPARNELEVCYFNLKPTTEINDTNSGANPNAVPARASNYTSSNPAQTSASAFQTGNAEAFKTAGDFYWSSTENDVTRSRGQFFSYRYPGYRAGSQSVYSKNFSRTVRAVRRVPV